VIAACAIVGEFDLTKLHLEISSAELNLCYFEEIILTLIVEFVLLSAIWVHEYVVDGNPDLRFSFGQFTIFTLGNYSPLAIFIDFSFTLLVVSEPRSLLNERHKDRDDVALH